LSPSHVDYLFSLEQIGIKLGLEQIRALLDRLGRPDGAFASIVVAGTNGKGSVTAMAERGLRAAGYRTGRYISPHLVQLAERFAIDGAPIDAGHLEELAGRIRSAATALPSPPSFFEATTAMAFDIFRRAGLDFAVVEVPENDNDEPDPEYRDKIANGDISESIDRQQQLRYLESEPRDCKVRDARANDVSLPELLN